MTSALVLRNYFQDMLTFSRWQEITGIRLHLLVPEPFPPLTLSAIGNHKCLFLSESNSYAWTRDMQYVEYMAG